MKTRSIPGVEVFSAGTWNGDPYSVADIDEMVRAFEETHKGYRPFLKLGHNEDQKLLAEDGLPAAGYIGQLYRKGEKLVADFIDVPDKIANLIDIKAYRKVSAEIYSGVKFNDKNYGRLLGAVALLGADMPGVHNLSDILSMYGLKDYETIKSYAKDGEVFTVKSFTTHNADYQEDRTMSKTERELELESKLLAEQKAKLDTETELKTFKSDVDAKAKELEAAQAKTKELEAKLFAQEKANAEKAVEATADSMVAEKLITKGMKPYVMQLLSNEPESKKFTFKAGDKDVELDKAGLVKEICKQFKAVSSVNFDESSEAGDAGASEESENKQLAEVEKYATENKVSFSEAYKAVFKGKLKQSTNKVDSHDDEL